MIRTMSKMSIGVAGVAAPPWHAWALFLLARVLRAASDAMGRQARRANARAQARTQALSGGPVGAGGMVEFHPLYRDASAPEGALYVDGKLVGTIVGLTRL